MAQKRGTEGARRDATGDAPPPCPKGGERLGAWFDAAAADAAVAFFEERLHYTTAEWAGKPFKLADWQREIVRTVFGWKLPDGSRLVRTVYIEIGRKNGKTEFAAGLLLLMLLGDGEFGAEIYSMAVDRDQAEIVFTKAVQMVGYDPELEAALETWKTSIYCPELVGSIKPLSAAPGTKHGFNPSGSVSDELHEWRDGELYQVVHDGMGARRQPLEVLITTAGIRGEGFGWEMHERAVKVRDGVIENPQFLPVIFAADADDDWTDEAVWHKANPGLAHGTPKIEFLRSQFRDAVDSPRLQNNFRRFHLCQWTEQSVRWLPIDKWDAAGAAWGEIDAAELEGRECWGGMDLSRKVDLSAFVLAFPPASDDEPWIWLPRFWVPAERIEVRGRRDGVPYRQWVDEGLITATPGNVVDYRFIRHEINALAERFGIQEIGFDPWAAQQLATELGDEDGFVMVEMRQGTRTLSEPMKFLEGLVLDGRLQHGGHAVLRWNASNIAVKPDVNENIQPDKAHSTERIDGIVAGIMATGRAMLHRNDESVVEIGEDYELAVA